MPRITALILLCVALATPATAKIYRWTDANGVIHFSDTPPKQQRHSSVTVQPPVTVPMSENIRQADKVRRSRAEVNRLLEPGSRDRYARARETEKLARQCEKYRKQLDVIQGQLRAVYGNERGNRLRQKRRQVSQLYSRECMLN